MLDSLPSFTLHDYYDKVESLADIGSSTTGLEDTPEFAI